MQKKDNPNARAVFIPRKEWTARKAAGVCMKCGQRGRAVTDCKNPKSAAPFQKSA